ncbi:MAG: ABC transporter permease [Puniceicoccaceae bacterium]
MAETRQALYLFGQLFRRFLAQSHKGSLLGVTWLFFAPLLQMAVYTVVFGMIFDGRYEGVEDQTEFDYALGIFLSLTLFQVLAQVLGSSPGAVLGQPNLVKKVKMPLEVIAPAHVAVALFHFLIGLVLVFGFMVYLGKPFTASFLLFPVLFAPVVLMAFGLGWLLAALGVFLRDIQNMVAPLSMILLYSSGIFYSTSMVPPSIWTFLRFNPLIHVVEQSRHLLLWGTPVEWAGVWYAYGFGAVLLVLGYWTFAKLKEAFADVV